MRLGGCPVSWFKKLLGISPVEKKTQSISKTIVEKKPAQKQNFSKDLPFENLQQDDADIVAPTHSAKDRERMSAFADVERHEKTFFATSTPRSIKAKITRLKKQLNSSGKLLHVEKAHLERRISQLENLLTDADKKKFDDGIRGIKLKEQQEKEKKDKIKDANNQRRAAIAEAIDTHYATLRRNFNRVYKLNDYGAVVLDKREHEFYEFLKSVGFKVFYNPDGWVATQAHSTNTKHVSKTLFKSEFKKFIKRIERDIAKEEKAGFDPDTIPENGHDFEYWVANSLQQFGWKALVSSGSGDQGIDVVATKNSKTVGIQCKLYSASVGNKAVQEAQAGMLHYATDYAVVISNAKYTKSAHELSKTTGVLLLSHKDIPQLDNILKI